MPSSRCAYSYTTVYTPGLPGAARLAEGDFLARHVLQLDRDVLEHMAQPGAFVFAHPAQEAAGLAIGAAVLGQAGQGGRREPST